MCYKMTKNNKENINKIYPREFAQKAIKLALALLYIIGAARAWGS